MNPTSDFLSSLTKRLVHKRGLAFGLILLLALFAFEIFNYSTTAFALTDMLGANLKFLSISWATILSIAFCGIDFAGIARLFTPGQGNDKPAEAWYLFGAWLLAAAMNALLTWWGVAVAVRSHQDLSVMVVGKSMVMNVVPVFVALMVWLIRVLIIGTFSMAGDRLFSMLGDQPAVQYRAARLRSSRSTDMPFLVRPVPAPLRPVPRPEPAYHPVGMAASARNPSVEIKK